MPLHSLGPTPPAARLPGPSRVSLELVLELGNTTREEERGQARAGTVYGHRMVYR